MTRDAAATLRKVAELRRLCLRLPHVATPAETMRRRRFDALIDAPAWAVAGDVDALAEGWARWWREGRYLDIVVMSASLRAGLVDSDLRLASWLTAAMTAEEEARGPRRDCGSADHAAAPALEEVGETVGHTKVSLNVVWTLVAGFLVMVMQAGFALAETGFTRARGTWRTPSERLIARDVDPLSQ